MMKLIQYCCFICW